MSACHTWLECVAWQIGARRTDDSHAERRGGTPAALRPRGWRHRERGRHGEGAVGLHAEGVGADKGRIRGSVQEEGGLGQVRGGLRTGEADPFEGDR